MVDITQEVKARLSQYPIDIDCVDIQQFSDIRLALIEGYCNTTFSDGPTTYVELHDGEGTEELLLDRRGIQTLVLVEILNYPYVLYQLSPSSYLTVPDQGLIRSSNIIDSSAYPLRPLFPKGRNNIRVTYTAGFATMPDIAKKALILGTCADILGDAAGQAGDANSLTVVAWSKGWGNPLGKYGNIRQTMYNQARALLKIYVTGVVGN